MPNYDFHALLEALEFQGLICDIIQVRDNIFLETYKEGRDLGIDGSYTDKTRRTIVQAKRYQQNFKQLKDSLKYDELAKVKKLNPYRYILGVSLNFQPGQKEEIVDLFEGYIKNTSDILSKNDINRLLRDSPYKRVELSYPKLWLPNITVLEKILKESAHRPIYRESTEELKQAIKTSEVFVPTRIYRKALQQWSHNNIIIISGEPGVGKTTMAYLLSLAYLQPDNLEGFIWANSISDVYAMLEDDQKQVIILDDFWGSIFHNEYTGRNDENRLNKLINRIAEYNGKKRLILTTREYILQQGLQRHPALRETLNKHALVCTMEEYSEDEKANILFRHLYASNLEYEYAYYLFEECDWIVNHHNYNPRVLSLFLAKGSSKGYSPEEYYDELCSYFDEPGDFWESIFVEISQEAQVVAMILMISSTPMSLADMDYCYNRYIQNCEQQEIVKNLESVISELEETMIKSFYSDEYDEILIKFTMPAVQDFLYSYIEKNSEQYIPLILGCCVFYNQLQFLFEYQSEKCSDRVLNLIMDKCILDYSDYRDSYIEFDGSWNWDVDPGILNQRGHLHRFFHLIRCCDPEKHLKLFIFLEVKIKEYCLTMGRGDLEAQYADLHNLPDIIVRCVNKGMDFCGEEILSKYYDEAFSVYHYLAMERFRDIFPEEYIIFNEQYSSKIKKRLEEILFNELEFLDDYCMDFELDVLLDNIPNVFERFGLVYTNKIGNKVFNLYGRQPMDLNKKESEDINVVHDKINENEILLKDVKKEAMNWIFGPKEIYMEEEQIVEAIENHKLNKDLEEYLKGVLDTCQPSYIYGFLQSKESAELLLTSLQNHGDSLPELEKDFYAIMVEYICHDNPKLTAKFVFFCAEMFSLIMNKEKPIMRKSEFLESEIYKYYLKDNKELYEIILENLIVSDEKWIRFLHIPIFIFCDVLFMIMQFDEDNLKDLYWNIGGQNFHRYKRKDRGNPRAQDSIYYCDYGRYYFKRYDWEGCFYRMLGELDIFHFKQAYVSPMLKSYLETLGNGNDDSRVLRHIAYCEIKLEYNEKGDLDSVLYQMGDDLAIIDHLSIAEHWNIFSSPIKKSRLIELQQEKKVCINNNGRWEIFLSNIDDPGLLKEIGIYHEVLRFIKEIERTYGRFLEGDY